MHRPNRKEHPANLEYLKHLTPLINLSLNEGLMLYQLALSVKCDIVEVGSYMGRSSCFLAAGSRAGNKCKVTCIDPWDLRSQKFETRRPDRLEVFAKPGTRTAFARQTRPYRHFIIAIRGYSKEVCRTWTRPVGLIFIDGNHDEAYADFVLWHRHVIEGGTMAFHDINFPHVARQIARVKETGILTDWRVTERLAYAQKK